MLFGFSAAATQPSGSFGTCSCAPPVSTGPASMSGMIGSLSPFKVRSMVVSSAAVGLATDDSWQVMVNDARKTAAPQLVSEYRGWRFTEITPLLQVTPQFSRCYNSVRGSGFHNTHPANGRRSDESCNNSEFARNNLSGGALLQRPAAHF